MPNVHSFKMRHKIWFYSFILSIVFVACFVFIINPYRIFPVSITIAGINDIKPKLYDYQRYVKLFDIAHQKPKTILLGSSRVLWGLDPKSSILQQVGYMPVYNAGVLGPPMYVTRQYFDHALASQPDLKRVILGIEYFDFNKAYDGRTFLSESFGKNESQLLKIHSKLAYDLKASVLTLLSSLSHKQGKSLREDGRLTPAPLESPEIYKDFFGPTQNQIIDVRDQDKRENINQRVLEKPIIHKETIAKASKPRQMKDILYGNFKLSKIDMDAFRYIVETCKERNIELYIFFTPAYNFSEINAFHQLGIWEDYKIFLRQIASIHPYWNFDGMNTVTTNRSNYVDGSHFVFSVGEMILKKMFNVSDASIPKNFGNYVTGKNVNYFLKNLEIEYAQTTNESR